MFNDKKTFNGNIHFVLLRGVGEPFSKADVALDDVYSILNSIGASVFETPAS